VTGEVFNVGGGRPVELMHVIGMLERIAARKADLEFMPEGTRKVTGNIGIRDI
jgi:hypothetical protein